MQPNEIAALFKAKCTTPEEFLATVNRAVKAIGSGSTYILAEKRQSSLERFIDTNLVGVFLAKLNPNAVYDRSPPTISRPSGTAIKDDYLAQPFFYNNGEQVREMWWWHREQLRIAFVYPCRSPIMQYVIEAFALAGYAIHPSTDPETPNAVSYTPDPTYGKADRQVKVASLGKLLRKLCPLLTDTHIAHLEAAHRAQIDPTFHLATTEEEIVHVYTHMEGDSGCMRYGDVEEKWGLPKGYHPAMVYAAPGTAVAYTKDDNGRILSRAVVFERADGQKCWIRIYGDATLRTKLMRAGYIEAPAVGMKIRAIKHPAPKYKASKNVWMVPYIDGVGGNQEKTDGTYGMIDLREPQYIRMLSRNEASALMEKSGVSNAATQLKQHSTIAATITPVDLSPWRCAISNEEVNPLANAAFCYVWIDGEIKRALTKALAAAGFNDTFRYYENSSERLVYCRSSEMPTVFDRYGVKYFDNPQARQHLEYGKLDPEHYPNEDGWVQIGSDYTSTGRYAEDGTVYLMRNADAGWLISAESERTRVFMPPEIARAMVAAGTHVQTLVLTGMRTLCEVGNPKLVKLRSGRSAVQGFHDIVQLHDGTWSTPRMVTTTHVLGRRVYIPIDESPDNIELSREALVSIAIGADVEVSEWARWWLRRNHVLPDRFSDDMITEELIALTKANIESAKQHVRRGLLGRGVIADHSYVDVHDSAEGPIFMQSGTATYGDALLNNIDKLRAALAAERAESPRLLRHLRLMLAVFDAAEQTLLPLIDETFINMLHSYWGVIEPEERDQLREAILPPAPQPEPTNDVAPTAEAVG